MTVPTRRTFVIIGGGVAGAEAAKALRAEGFDGRVILIAGESHVPYQRPPLSKDYLRGEATSQSLLALDADFYGREDVELLTGRRALELNAAEGWLGLDDGRIVRFDGLVLATGATPKRPTFRGSDRPFVHLIRTIEDADRLRAATATAGTAVVAGGGWIAAETAASLALLGLDVTLAVPGEEVLERTLGPIVGSRYTALHRSHGVRIATRARVTEVLDDRRGPGVRLADGTVLRGDIVVLGFGATPNVDLARDAGIPVDGGIIVDERLRTGATRIVAAGDVAAAWHPRYQARLRSEHWDNARRQGRTAARTLLGHREAYERLPYFYSDQFELGMEFVGRAAEADEVLIRDEQDSAGFVALWLRRGAVVAGLHGNVWDAKPAIDRLVDSEALIDPVNFRDPSVPVGELAALVESAA
jgi:3-phenylpropionate/trans-cinnamate dioxygenase ferredoxin reductase component